MKLYNLTFLQFSMLLLLVNNVFKDWPLLVRLLEFTQQAWVHLFFFSYRALNLKLVVKGLLLALKRHIVLIELIWDLKLTVFILALIVRIQIVVTLWCFLAATATLTTTFFATFTASLPRLSCIALMNKGLVLILFLVARSDVRQIELLVEAHHMLLRQHLSAVLIDAVVFVWKLDASYVGEHIHSILVILLITRGKQLAFDALLEVMVELGAIWSRHMCLLVA